MKLWFRFTRADQAEETVPASNACLLGRKTDEGLVDLNPCDLKKWRRVLKKCANKKRAAKESAVTSAPKKPSAIPPIKKAKCKPSVESKSDLSTSDISKPADVGPVDVKTPPEEKSEVQTVKEAVIRSPSPEVRTSSPKIESGKSSRSDSIPAEESAISDWDSNSASELVIDISTPTGITDEDETKDKKSDEAEQEGKKKEPEEESLPDQTNHSPEEEKPVKNWLPKAVFDLDDRDLWAKRLQRETAGIAESDEVKENEAKEPSVAHAVKEEILEQPVAVSSPLSVKVPADESDQNGMDSPDVHDSIGALDLSGRSGDSSSDSPVPEPSSPVKVTSPNGIASKSPSGRNYGPHPYFLTPSAIYSGFGLLQPSLIPATTAPSASVVEPIKTSAPIRADANGSDLKRKALMESQRLLKKPKRGLWDLFGIPTSTSSAGIASTLTELNSIRRLMLPPSSHPT